MPDPSDTLAAVVRTLVMYALAEAQAGHARTIQVTTDGAAFSVADDGRGHPLAREVEGTPYLQLVYTHLDHPFGPCVGPLPGMRGDRLIAATPISSRRHRQSPANCT